MAEWIKRAVFYHIYTLGFCGAPKENVVQHEDEKRILKVMEWIPYFKELGINAIYFGPLFESKSHGYDTKDYYQVDKRLGSNDDFKQVCKALHKEGIKVVVDGVFNHVGRDFWAFKDLQQKGSASQYKDWFQNINFNGKSSYGDNFSYEGWEGHYNLVQLNLKNPELVKHLFGAIEKWIKEFDIDGIRLDVAYCMDETFFKQMRNFVDSQKQDFWLMGEMIHGDYRRLIKPDLLDSTTNYECYKGIYSSHNDKNYFEINYSLNRLFGAGGLYKNFLLYNFVDNHDVARIGSILKNKAHISNVYTLLFTMPGVPSIYYGSEWAIAGEKGKGSDDDLRPELKLKDMQKEDQTALEHIKKLVQLRMQSKALACGEYKQILVKNEQLIFERSYEDESVFVVLNLADHDESLSFKVDADKVTDYLDETVYTIKDGMLSVTIPAFEAKIFIDKK